MTRQYWTMFIVSCWLSTVPVFAEWPMWQADAARSGYTSAPLPAQMSRQWTWEPLHAPQPAWPRDERMSFDRAAQVIAVRGFVFFGSSVDGQIYSLDAETGELQWMFSTDGPIRFAPVAWQNRLYAVSDDGHLYCLNADTGALVDRWRGGPADDRVLGNGRIVSRWPARGGPVVYEGVLS